MAGLGIAFMSESSVEHALAAGEVIKLNVKGLPINRQWFIIHPQQKILSRLAAAFKEYLVTTGIESSHCVSD